MKEIQLTQGKVALVDDADFERVNKHKWHAIFDGHNWYAGRNGETLNGVRGKNIRLHRFILGIEDTLIQVDHEDHNGLNCQRYNMREATHSQNQGNCRKRGNGSSSKYIGVSFKKANNRFVAQITIDGSRKHLGSFVSEDDAARAYDEAAIVKYGKFANLNYPPVSEAASLS